MARFSLLGSILAACAFLFLVAFFVHTREKYFGEAKGEDERREEIMRELNIYDGHDLHSNRRTTTPSFPTFAPTPGPTPLFPVKYDSRCIVNSFGVDGRLIFPNNGTSQGKVWEALSGFVDAIPVNGGTQFLALASVSASTFSAAGFLAMFDHKGVLDKNFGDKGIAIVDSPGDDVNFNSLAVWETDGSIAVIGEDTSAESFTIVRLFRNGTVNPSFQLPNQVSISWNSTATENRRDIFTCGQFQTDGKLLVAGVVEGVVPFVKNQQVRTRKADWLVARVLKNGKFDSTFTGKKGYMIVDFYGGYDAARSLSIDPTSESIYVSGYATSAITLADFALIRILPTGVLDSTFGVKGKVTTDFNKVVDVPSTMILQDNGKIILGGSTSFGKLNKKGYSPKNNKDFALARYTTNGILDKLFGSSGKVQTDFSKDMDAIEGLVVDSNGNIIATGITAYPGTNCFSVQQKPQLDPIDPEHLCDGYTELGVARYTSNGILDTSFGKQGLTRITPVPQVREDVAGDFRGGRAIFFSGNQEVVVFGEMTHRGVDDTWWPLAIGVKCWKLG